tara:strand:- start:736 stop:2409 length:1674 start_codon:yes stop_codon:yes gene_type:complete
MNINPFKWFSKRGLTTPANWLVEALTGGGSTTSGVSVTEDNALQLSAVWACVRVISETVGSLPLMVYRRDGMDRQILREHPLFTLLHDCPNPDMTAMQFREALQMHVLTWGNGYARIERDGRGQPVAFWPIVPSVVVPSRNEAGELLYIIRRPSDMTITDKIPGMNMLHVSGPSPDGIVGYSPVRIARESMGLTKAAEQYAGGVFGNNSRPGGVLEHPGVLKPEAAKTLRKDWEAMHGGSANANKTAILEEGMKFNPISFPPEDAQMITSRQFQVEEIARWYNVPPHKIQHLLRATFSNIESQQVSFGTDTIRPWLVRWEQEIKRKLFPNQQDTFAEHIMDAVLRGDSKSRSEALQIQFLNGAVSINEWRQLENRNSIEDGDQHYVQMNLQAVGVDGPSGTDAGPPPAGSVEAPDETNSSSPLDGLVRAHRPLLAFQIGRVLRTEADKLKRARRREKDLDAWLDKFYAEHRKHVRLEIIPPVDAFVDAARSVMGIRAEAADVDTTVADLTERLADRHVADSRAALDGDWDAAFSTWSDRADGEAGAMMFDLVGFVRN